VRALCRESASLNDGGLSGGAVLTRKVGLSLSLAAAPRSYISRLCAPSLSRPHHRNTQALTPRTSISNAWNNTRYCSSHASSSLVKMATDRDILSDEYVSLLAFMPHAMLELRSR
jgi:hypothetical protein